MQTGSDANCDLRFCTEKTLAACRTFTSVRMKQDFNLSAKTWRYFKWCRGRNSSAVVKLWLKPSTAAHIRVWALAVSHELLRVCRFLGFFTVCSCVGQVITTWSGGKPPLELPLFGPSWLSKRKTWLHHCLPHSRFPEPDQPVVGLGRGSTVHVFLSWCDRV